LQSVFLFAGEILEWMLAMSFVVLAFTVIYYFAPDVKEQRWYWIIPGSVVGVLLWAGASATLRGYLHFSILQQDLWLPRCRDNPYAVVLHYGIGISGWRTNKFDNRTFSRRPRSSRGKGVGGKVA
jgi:putative effector of murein hydrolase